jgi:hypothetical protein
MSPIKRRILAMAVASVFATWLAAPVHALGLEGFTAALSVPVAVPPVKAPALPVKLPPLPKVPPVIVPVKAPTPPVKAPTPPVKSPVKIPSAPVKAPTPRLKAPTVPVKAPPVPGKSPTGTSNGPSNGPAPHITVKAPGAPVSRPSQPNTTQPSPSVTQAGSSSSGSGASVSSQNSGAAPSGQGGRGSAPFSGYGGLPQLSGARGLPRGAQAALRRERAVRALVLSLRGCLANLPDRLRLVLELRTGVNVANALGPKAVAAYVHVPVKEIAPLEMSGLRQLRGTAATNGCGETAYVQPILLLTSELGETTSGGPQASGGVDGARYSKSPSQFGQSAPAPQSGSPLGLALPAGPASRLLWIMTALAGSLLLALLFADGLGTGPRHQHWRSRWLGPPRRALRNIRPRR